MSWRPRHLRVGLRLASQGTEDHFCDDVISRCTWRLASRAFLLSSWFSCPDGTCCLVASISLTCQQPAKDGDIRSSRPQESCPANKLASLEGVLPSHSDFRQDHSFGQTPSWKPLESARHRTPYSVPGFLIHKNHDKINMLF